MTEELLKCDSEEKGVVVTRDSMMPLEKNWVNFIDQETFLLHPYVCFIVILILKF